MQPITIEFNVKKGDATFTEDSVTLDSAEAFFAYIAPGGGCENMPPDLGEIQMMFLPSKHPNRLNPIADKPVTLQLGMVMMSGPLAVIVQVSQEIIDKLGRGELSEAFLSVVGVEH